MKFTYAYKTSDGTRHEAAMDAESREAVFMALRQRGIKAIKVVAADGSKANGEIRGVRKRVLAATAIGAAILAIIGTVMVGRGFRLRRDEPSVFALQIDSNVRRQVIGDSAIIEKGIRTGWSDVFELEGERFLASFAIPGVKAGQRSTSEEKLREALRSTPSASRSASLEARQICAMVEGMKKELRAYLAAGGSIVEYGKRLVERQEAELAIYERTKAEIESARRTMSEDDLFVFWEKRNDELRNLGIRPVVLDE